MAGGGMAALSSVLGAPGKASPDPTDANEADEGGEGELATHLRAFFKAGNAGRMTEAEDAFRAAVAACGGYSKPMG